MTKDNPMPLKIKTEEDIKRERERFFQGCKRVVRSPACIFLEGNRFSFGPLKLGHLAPGQGRFLTSFEARELRKAVDL